MKEAVELFDKKGLFTTVRNDELLVVYSGIDDSTEIHIYENCHQIRKVNDSWCVYFRGQAPEDEFAEFDAAVKYTVNSME
ncbi:MAG: hypothetical protein ACPGJI_07890, partial [Kangiellaceae bacterium]